MTTPVRSSIRSASMRRAAAFPIGALALGAALLTGCAAGEPATSPPQSEPAPTSQEPGTPEPTTEPSPEPTPDPGAWERFEVGDGSISWAMPPGWAADVSAEVVPGEAELTDHLGLVLDESGTPMLRFDAVSEGQYASDSQSCERPETEVLAQAPLDAAIGDSGAAVVTLAYQQDDRVVFAAGVSQNDPDAACEPGILAVYGAAGYDYLRFEIVGDGGEAPPTFGDFDAARDYLDSTQYGTIADVLASFEVQ